MTAVESGQKPKAPTPAAGPATAAAAGAATGAGPAPAAPAAPPAATPPPPPDGGAVASAIGVAVTLLAVLVLGFAGYLYFLSGVQEARAQTGMYATLKTELGAATAPVGSPQAPVPGTPLAILSIPVIGVHNEVVVQGTSPENMTLGPGHLRDTPLPGDYGVSVLYGRRASFGGPFAKVPELKSGDRIKVTTGQGTATYVVRVVGDSAHRILIDGAPNQLVLMTADSSLMPSHYIEVEANLVSTPQTNAGDLPGVTNTETALANDPTSLILTMAWGLALVAVAAAGTVAASRWSRWPAYMVAIPIALAIVWNLYQSISALLPNLY
ncbi:MAG TPA: class E sortase [Streptosporangiaceae bacterium]|jgi:LPXTG-site transpeptidase (sortase) family protein